MVMPIDGLGRQAVVVKDAQGAGVETQDRVGAVECNDIDGCLERIAQKPTLATDSCVIKLLVYSQSAKKCVVLNEIIAPDETRTVVPSDLIISIFGSN